MSKLEYYKNSLEFDENAALMYRNSFFASLSQDSRRASTRLDKDVQNAKLCHVLDYAWAHLRTTIRLHIANAGPRHKEDVR